MEQIPAQFTWSAPNISVSDCFIIGLTIKKSASIMPAGSNNGKVLSQNSEKAASSGKVDVAREVGEA